MTKFYLDGFMKFVANQINFVPPLSSPSKKKDSTEKNLRISEKFERGDGWLELGLLKLPSFGKKANGRVSGAPETCFFMFFGLNAAPSKTSNLSTFLSFQSQV